MASRPLICPLRKAALAFIFPLRIARNRRLEPHRFLLSPRPIPLLRHRTPLGAGRESDLSIERTQVILQQRFSSSNLPSGQTARMPDLSEKCHNLLQKNKLHFRSHRRQGETRHEIRNHLFHMGLSRMRRKSYKRCLVSRFPAGIAFTERIQCWTRQLSARRILPCDGVESASSIVASAGELACKRAWRAGLPGSLTDPG